MQPTQVVRLIKGVRMEPLYRNEVVDCRRFLLGDRYRQLLRVYPEVIRRLSRNGNAAAEVLESAEINQYYNVSAAGSCVRLTLRDAAFQEQYPLSSDDFSLRIVVGSRATMVPLPLELFRALGMLLPLLAGNHGDSDISARLQQSLDAEGQDWARDLVAILDKHGYLERGSIRPNSFLVSDARPRVTLVGHTSILFQTANASILTDPLLRLEFAVNTVAKALDVTRLDLTAICCTHAHWDHCDIETLLRFDKRIPIVIPRVHQPTAFNPPIEPVLRRLGFQEVREVDPWETIQLGDVKMVVVPFHGEQDEPGAKIDHYTYVYSTPGLTLYGGVDAYRDSFADMDGVLNRVREEYHPSLAFLPISRMMYNVKYGGVNAFCRYVDSALLDKEFQYTAGPQEAAEWVRALGVSTVVPYATFTFSRWATPAQVNEFAAALNQQGLGRTLLPLRPLDALDPSDLDGSRRATRRRRLLCGWHRTGARASKLDRRLRQVAGYRFVRRILSGAASAAAGDHHH